MKITRRSFVKKSSYSAAAVTVLGTGVSLALHSSWNQPPPQVRWSDWTLQIQVATVVTLTVDNELPGNTDFREMFVNEFSLNGDLDLDEDAVETAFGLAPELGPLRVVQFLEIAPPQPGVPSVSVVVEELLNGKFKYTLTSNYGFTVELTNRPMPVE